MLSARSHQSIYLYTPLKFVNKSRGIPCQCLGSLNIQGVPHVVAHKFKDGTRATAHAKTKSMTSTSSAEQAYNERRMPSAEELSTTLNPSVGPNQITVDIRREFHNEETSTYWLPKDEDEQKRLTGQHFALKELFGGNMLSSVSDALDFEKGVSVLDIGCGSGVWIMDMINDYPNSTYHGCDIVDVVNKSMKLDQFTFNHGNVAKGLPYADNTFDFVHMRLLVYALRKDEWPVAIKEAIRVVKPGGILQLVEGEPRLPKDTSCAYYKFTEAINNVGYMRGQNPRVILEIEELVAANDNIKVLQSDARCSDMSKFRSEKY
ncbi:hypothetical protein G6F52_006833 [Rhizopus delemar]|nr:hypothetical protein G6F54_009658 [Rhizopus delemar]KAG1521340.1 hypothetical protein G6F52_006833 [Rhizopus delemar]